MAAVLLCVQTAGQSGDADENIMRFMGAESLEDIDEENAERLAVYINHPLRLNQASMSRIVSSGLLSRYQAVSLADYRSRHGDVLSLVELSMIDGFGICFVERLAPFISLDSGYRPGQNNAGHHPVRTEITTRAGMKYNDGVKGTGAVKVRMESGRRLNLSLAMSSPYGRFEADRLLYTASAELSFVKVPVRVLAGDFNARFGQGLILRNGMSLSTLASPSAFMKNPTGISLTSSYTGTAAFTGTGCEASFRNVVLTGFLAFPGIRQLKNFKDDFRIMPALNVSWFCRHGQIAVTHYAVSSLPGQSDPEESGMWTAVDTRWCFNGCDLFAEAAYDWKTCSPAALAGTLFPLGGNGRIAVMARWYPPLFHPFAAGAYGSGTTTNNEYGVTLSSEIGSTATAHRLVLTADAAHFPLPKKDDRGGSAQIKGLLVWEYKPFSVLTVKTRITERFRTWGMPFRTDIRTDVMYESGIFSAALRLNVLKCAGWGLLSYVEAGSRRKKCSVFLRQGFFRIDDWQDRIYVYERDAPGSFNVPACYGRGLWTAVTCSARFSIWGKLYLRAAYTSYVFMRHEIKKPGRAELKMHFVCSF